MFLFSERIWGCLSLMHIKNEERGWTDSSDKRWAPEWPFLECQLLKPHVIIIHKHTKQHIQSHVTISHVIDVTDKQQINRQQIKADALTRADLHTHLKWQMTDGEWMANLNWRISYSTAALEMLMVISFWGSVCVCGWATSDHSHSQHVSFKSHIRRENGQWANLTSESWNEI